MPKRVTKVMRRASRQKTLPKAVITRAEEIKADVEGPGTNYGELMPTEIMKGKVPATEQQELIVWDNRQKSA